MRGWRPARRTGRSGRPSPCPARPGARSAAPGTPRPRNLTAGPALDPGAIPCAAVSERVPFPFIVACGRSGTTMLRVMFEQHPDIAIPPESYFPVSFFRRRERYAVSGGSGVDLEFRPEMLAYRQEDLARIPLTDRMRTSGAARPPGESRRDWRTQMTPRQLAVVEAVAGAQLEAFGYERAARNPGARARATAAAVKAWRRTGGRLAGGVAARLRRGSSPQTGT